MRRQVTTREELDALPVESVIRDADEYVFEQFAERDSSDRPRWFLAGQALPERVALPAIVLWRPDEVEVDGDEREACIAAEWSALATALEFGDGITEPQASPAQVADIISTALDEAREHQECPVICEACGERLAETVCPQCGGGGCLPNAELAYLECGTCGGVGRIHDGCVEKSYAELAEIAGRQGAVSDGERDATPDEAHDIGYTKGHIDGYREAVAERATVTRARVEALCRLLADEGHMTPMAKRQILRLWDES